LCNIIKNGDDQTNESRGHRPVNIGNRRGGMTFHADRPFWKAFGDVDDSTGSQPRSNILFLQTTTIKKLEKIFYSLTKI